MNIHQRYAPKDYAVEHDRILVRGNGTGDVKRSLELTGLVIGLLLVVAGLVFWNALLPFYGLVCWAGGM